LYIWAPEEEGQFQPGRCSRWWAKRTVVKFAAQLAALGSPRLVVRRADDSARALLQAAAECGASAVFFNHLYDPISLVRDHEVKGTLRAAGVAAHTSNGDLLYEPWEVLDPGSGLPYTRFDDFWAACQAMPRPPAFPLPPPESFPPLPAALQAALPGLDPGSEVDWFFSPEQEATAEPLAHRWQPGPEGASARLEAFVSERLPLFEHDRAKVDREFTSRLSPWIHFGSISVRYIYYRVRHAVADAVARAERLERAAAAEGEGGGAAAGGGLGLHGAGGEEQTTGSEEEERGACGNRGSPAGADRDGDAAMGEASGGEEEGGGGGGECEDEPRRRHAAARPAASSADEPSASGTSAAAAASPGHAQAGQQQQQRMQHQRMQHQRQQQRAAPKKCDGGAAAAAALAAASSARAAADALARSGADFLRQMGYREYARYLSYHFPYLHERSLLAHLRTVPWRVDRAALSAWRAGQTGYPLVDAGMRQLWSTGWIHNRLRVVCASFAVKHLLLPWQWGLKHYWDAFLDADLENDALGWQYVAGCMADAHPFAYMIDLEAEATRFDPDGEFVRRWLPALARLPTRHVHAPWGAPPEVLEAAGVELGLTYPRRIVLLEEARGRVSGAVEVIERCCAAQAEQAALAQAVARAAAVAGAGAGADGGGRSEAAAAVAEAAAAERVVAAGLGAVGAGVAAARFSSVAAGGGSCDGPYRLATDPAVLSSSWAAAVRAAGAGGLSGSVAAPAAAEGAAAAGAAAAAANGALVSTGAGVAALSEPGAGGPGSEAAERAPDEGPAAGSNTRFFAGGGGTGGASSHLPANGGAAAAPAPAAAPAAAAAGARGGREQVVSNHEDGRQPEQPRRQQQEEQRQERKAAPAPPFSAAAPPLAGGQPPPPPPEQSTGSAAATVAAGCGGAESAGGSGSVAGGVAVAARPAPRAAGMRWEPFLAGGAGNGAATQAGSTAGGGCAEAAAAAEAAVAAAAAADGAALPPPAKRLRADAGDDERQ